MGWAGGTEEVPEPDVAVWAVGVCAAAFIKTYIESPILGHIIEVGADGLCLIRVHWDARVTLKEGHSNY